MKRHYFSILIIITFNVHVVYNTSNDHNKQSSVITGRLVDFGIFKNGIQIPSQEVFSMFSDSRRRLTELSDGFSLRINMKDFYNSRRLTDIGLTEISCDNLHSMGKYSAIDEDVKIVTYTGSNSSIDIGYTSNTFMAKDFSCVVTFTGKEDGTGVHVQGVDFRGVNEDKGDREFKIHPCNDEGNCITISSNSIPSDRKCGVIFKDFKENEKILRNLEEERENRVPFSQEKWYDCYEDDEFIHEVSMGIAIGSEMVKTFGKDRVLPFIEAVVSETNVIYLQQFNFKLVVKEIHMISPSIPSNISWDNRDCTDTIGEQLDNFLYFEKPQYGLWKLLDDCFVSDTIGLAVVMSLCRQSGVGVSYYDNYSGTYKIFAHEVGHIFGAFHSFEEGVGVTGGIMDYGFGDYKDYIQFNTKYRKEEVCSFLQSKLTCPYINVLTRDVVVNAPTCGNGKLDVGEECDCPQGRDCPCCKDCLFKENARCSPVGNECCTDECFYQPSSVMCSHSEGFGYCRNGFCAISDCPLMSQEDYCGVESIDRSCKKSCLTSDGTCEPVGYYPYLFRDVAVIMDGSFCQTSTVDFGQCFDGECLEVIDFNSTLKPTVSPTPFPTIVETEYPTKNPTVSPTTSGPSVSPTLFPTPGPTGLPSAAPTQLPTGFPSVSPTNQPTEFPSNSPSQFPTGFPTGLPTGFPTPNPTQFPTGFPTKNPTQEPTSFPTAFPTTFPTSNPTLFPTNFPTSSPTQFPTAFPTKFPIDQD